jgi:isopentenyl-diphosphate delta-isomerase
MERLILEQELNPEKKDTQIEKRKLEHIMTCIENNVKARNKKPGFEDVFMIHRCLPEINREEIDLSIEFLGHKLSAPLIITGLTGGAHKAMKINSSLAEAVEELGLAAFIMANIGGIQLKKAEQKTVKKTVEMVEADALTIHLNPLQEAVQPEGETDYSGILSKIELVTRYLDIPVIVKETGAGISAEDANKLYNANISGIDIAGAGGTSWSAIEYYRSKKKGNIEGEELGEKLWDWGIPTIVSLIEVSQTVDIPIIASGGIRNGLDIAKTLAIGANIAGVALPVLKPALKNSAAVSKKMNLLIHQLKTVMFLVSASSVKELKNVPLVISGTTALWLKSRGFNLDTYAKRGAVSRI